MLKKRMWWIVGASMLGGIAIPAIGQEGAAPDAAAPEGERVGEPYALATCPITGKELGAMGDPVIEVYDGREVRFCCAGCPPKFEKDLAASLAKIDEKIIKDQGPLYPLKTSIVTGAALPEKPHEFVYGNRLIRVGAEAEEAEFLKDPRARLEALNKAVVEAQSADYPLKTCPASGDELGGMGDPVDFVIAGRLIRLCCEGCEKDIEAEPARFVAMVDEARKAAKGKADPEQGAGNPPK
jgi:hypothetical protein